MLFKYGLLLREAAISGNLTVLANISINMLCWKTARLAAMTGCNYCTTNFIEVKGGLVVSFISIIFSLTNMKNVQFNLTSCESNLFLKFKQWDKMFHHPIIWSDKTNFWPDIVCWLALISRSMTCTKIWCAQL